MSAHGHLARKPSDESALLVLDSANPVYRATYAKPMNLACHLKQSSHVVEDHHTNVSVPDTKILHDGQDDKPTITLTVYEKKNSPEESVLHTITAISESHADEEFTQGLDGQLKRQLENHFRGLRDEYEAKTGRAWEPLRAWPAEEWEWAWDNEEA